MRWPWQSKPHPAHRIIASELRTLVEDHQTPVTWSIARQRAPVVGHCDTELVSHVSFAPEWLDALTDEAVGSEAERVLRIAVRHEYAHALSVVGMLMRVDHSHPEWVEATNRCGVSSAESLQMTSELSDFFDTAERGQG